MSRASRQNGRVGSADADARYARQGAQGRTDLALGSVATFSVSSFPGVWTPSTAYNAGRLAISPSGDVVSAISTHTSGASYDPTLWSLSSTYALSNSVLPKVAAKACATTNVTISSPGATVDGIALVSGDRVLLAGQTAAAENGVYVWTGPTAAMTRATDLSTAAKIVGAFLYISQGKTQAGAGWMNTNTAITLGTTAVTWAQFYVPPTNISSPATYRTGQCYWCNSAGGRGTAALTMNSPRATQWQVWAPVTIVSFFVEMTGAGDPASVFRIGVWADDGAGYPSTLIRDAGTISGGSGNAGTVATGGVAGVYELTLGTPLTLQPGLYWIGGANQGTGTAPTIGTVGATSIVTPFPLGVTLPTTPTATYVGVVGAAQSGAFGAFTSAAPNGSAPRIGFRVA